MTRTPLPTPLPAQTGTCPACGEQMGTRDGLARHNLHASAGERVYATSLVRFVGLAKLERKVAALLLLTLAACASPVAPAPPCTPETAHTVQRLESGIVIAYCGGAHP